jgi:hypothetical protein
MAYYEPTQRLVWKYDSTDGKFKIVSTIKMEINTGVDKHVTVESSGLVDDVACVLNLDVVVGTNDEDSPVTKTTDIIVEDIGTGQSKAYVEAKILAYQPIEVQANVDRNDIRLDSVSNSATKESKLEYN